MGSTTDPFVVEPNAGNAQLAGSGQRKPNGGVVANEAGTTIDDHMTTGAFLNGVVRLLEARKGVGATTTGLGKYVRIQTA